MTDETVLITGIQGFVGGALARRLTAEGYRVRGLARRDADLPGVEVVRGDIADRHAMVEAAHGVTSVVHCVANFGSDMTEALRVNVEGTRSIGDAALEHGCERLVHVSTCGVYDLRGVESVAETTPMWAFDGGSELVYGVTKAEAERVVWDLADRGLGTVVLRPPNVLGPSHLNSWSYHIALRIRDGGFAIGGDGGNTWPYVVLDNLLDALVLALRSPNAVGETYTVVDGHTTWGAYAGIFADWLGVRLERREPKEPYDTFFGRFSTDKVRRELGWTPRVTFDEVMEQTRAFLEVEGVLATA